MNNQKIVDYKFVCMNRLELEYHFKDSLCY